MEALLFGQAGFLEDTFADDYYLRLQLQYKFIKHKYQLQPLPKHIWKFMRMRPVNFPTIRIAQLAALLCNTSHLCAQLTEIKSLNVKAKLLNETTLLGVRAVFAYAAFTLDVAEVK